MSFQKKILFLRSHGGFNEQINTRPQMLRAVNALTHDAKMLSVDVEYCGTVMPDATFELTLKALRAFSISNSHK